MDLGNTFIMKYAELLFDTSAPKKLHETKLDAFLKARALVEQYAQKGIREDLLDVIMEKKLENIQRATTADEVRRAADPPKPQYSYGRWIEDPFTVPEEEMVCWSITSLHHLLNAEAQKRYMDLFRQVYGTDPVICAGAQANTSEEVE